MKKITVFIFLCILLNIASGQDIKYARYLIDTLCSESMHGRGAEFKGDSIAANFLLSEIKKLKLSAFEDTFLQYFYTPVNTMSGEISVKIDNNTLTAGEDYLIKKTSNTCKGSFKIVTIDKALIQNTKKFKKLLTSNLSSKFILIDTAGLHDKSFKITYDKIVTDNMLNAKGIILVTDAKLVHAVSTQKNDFVTLVIKREKLGSICKKIDLVIESEFIANYKTQNVIAYLKGEVDTFIVLTAHYDHLGHLGNDVYFPGAHDNASGVSLCMDLIKEFAQSKTIPHYSIAIMLFSGEELGLLGSYFYNKNNFIDHKKIRFLINIDLAGSGDKGIHVVNGQKFDTEFNLLKSINEKENLLPVITARGEAANSDHYFFYENKVKCFFIYTSGEYQEYHNIYDKAKGLPLNEYDDYFKLLKRFIKTIK